MMTKKQDREARQHNVEEWLSRLPEDQTMLQALASALLDLIDGESAYAAQDDVTLLYRDWLRADHAKWTARVAARLAEGEK